MTSWPLTKRQAQQVRSLDAAALACYLRNRRVGGLHSQSLMIALDDMELRSSRIRRAA